MMKTLKLLWIIGLLLSLVGCGGTGEARLGAFDPITKTEGDPPFTLTPPKSNSPGGFTYTSSDQSVATISGNIVTILHPGTTTITATQDAVGSFSATSKSTVLTVLPITCTAPQVDQNGKCVQPPTCTNPATLQNNVCVAPTATGNFVTKNGRVWAPVTFISNWTDANSYCTTTTINGVTGWRLPTQFELSDLYASGLMNGQGWTLSKTWSSTPSVNGAGDVVQANHVAVNLSTGASTDELDGNGAYVACIR